MTYKIIGFCDLLDKPAQKQNTSSDRYVTHFKPEHQFITDKLPSPAVLIAHATQFGYWPSGRTRAQPEICDAVYELVD